MDTKRCPKCETTKPITAFSKHKVKGHQSQCKPCKRATDRAYYQSNKSSRKERVRNRNEQHRGTLRNFVWDYLLEHPCVVCGESDPLVLEFDHLRDKKSSVSVMVARAVALKTLQDEIAKCNVRCANCHRRKTVFDHGHWKAGFVGD